MADTVQIISSRSFLFEQETYHKGEDKDGNEVITRKVDKRIRVTADTRPQIVPEWVTKTDLFEIAVDDGSIIEVVAAAPRIRQPLRLDPSTRRDPVEQAKIVGDDSEAGAIPGKAMTQEQALGLGASGGNAGWGK